MDSSILYVENTKCSHFSFNNFCTIVANLCWPACTRLILLLLGVLKLYKQFFTMIYITSVVLSASKQVNFGLSCAKHDNDKFWHIYYMNWQLVWGRRAKPMSSFEPFDIYAMWLLHLYMLFAFRWRTSTVNVTCSTVMDTSWDKWTNGFMPANW